MDIATIGMEPDEAKNAYEEYRAGFDTFQDGEYERLAQLYKHLASGKQIIDLHAAMQSAGVNDDGFPILAVARADAKKVYLRSRGNGHAIFYWDWDHRSGLRQYKDGDALIFPAGTLPKDLPAWDTWSNGERFAKPEAMVPIVPPRHRPKFGLSNYHIVWDAEWAIKTPAPRDPILCKRIPDTYLFVLLAIWDLTDIERAVIMGTRG